jgi:hypothetical protein
MLTTLRPDQRGLVSIFQISLCRILLSFLGPDLITPHTVLIFCFVLVASAVLFKGCGLPSLLNLLYRTFQKKFMVM